MKPSYYFIIIPIIALITLSCQDTIINSELQLSRRDYVWTVDTIRNPLPMPSFQIAMWAMCCLDTNDIFVGGHNSMSTGQVFHYDGSKWLPVEIPRFNYGKPFFTSIYAINKNEIYFAGENAYNITSPGYITRGGLILHYNGKTFTSSLIDKGTLFYSVSGTQNELYAGGSGDTVSTLFKFNGIKWEKENFNFPLPTGFIEGIVMSLVKRKNGTLMMNYNIYQSGYGTVSYYQFIKRENKWVKADSFKVTNPPDPNFRWKWGLKMWESPNGTLYSVFGGGTYSDLMV